MKEIITAVLSAGTAFGGVWYGQWRITQREEEAATAKLVSERLFIATELVFLLERFAQRCAPAATATVEHDQDGRGEAEYLDYRKSIIPRYLVTGAPFLLA